jgi:hypothetical protein
MQKGTAQTRQTVRHTKHARATSVPAPIASALSRPHNIQTRPTFLITDPRLETAPNPNKAKAVNEF